MDKQICEIMKDTVIYSATKFSLDALISDKTVRIHKLQFEDSIIYAVTDAVYFTLKDKMVKNMAVIKNIDLAKPVFLIMGVTLGDYIMKKERSFVENIITIGVSQGVSTLVDSIRVQYN